jgi:hypothetical protein
MNAGIAFARTLRALDADDFHASKFSLLLVAAILAAWTWWLLAARVPQYASSDNARFELDPTSQTTTAVADFPPSADKIHPGQPAQIGFVYQENIAARVASVHTLPHLIRVHFQFLSTPETLDHPVTATVEVDRISPAAIALRTLGRASR